MKQLFFFTLFVFSINISQSQTAYTKLWEEVEELELSGKYKSSNEQVEKIYKKAIRSKNDAQIVKSLIFKSKFTLLLEENARPKIIDELEQQISISSFPLNALLESVYASFLEQYLDRNRYKIRNRTKIEEDINATNFESWDINTFIKQIIRRHENSLLNKIQLQKISLKKYEAILSKSNTSLKYRPTLYDFLANRALEFYDEDKWYITRPKERFYINNEVAFKPTYQFIKEPFKTSDSIFSNYKVVKLFQELESFHFRQDTTAYINVVLERLKYIKLESTLNKKDSLYVVALKQLVNEYTGHESSSSINYEIADHYYQTSRKNDAKNNPEYSKYRVKAVEYCNKALETYPNSDGGLIAAILKNKIEQPELRLSAEKYIVPDKPFLAEVEFRNIDSIFISSYKISFNSTDNFFIYRQDSTAIEIIRNHEPIQTSSYTLQDQKDFYKHTTEIALPNHKKGLYLIVVSKVPTIQNINDIHNYQTIIVSDLSMINLNTQNSLDIRVLDRENGSPVENVKINVTANKDFQKQGYTDDNGTFSISKTKNYHQNLNIIASIDNDTLIGDVNYLNSKYNKANNETEERLAKMSLFLDRSIYRPGQTLYFKGILTEVRKGVPKVVPNVYISVFINDANGEEIKEFRLKTNEFGSISGEFKIPTNVMTGEFYIEMDEDWGTLEEDEDPYYEKIDDLEYAEVEFRVEEYKRPTFEVIFNNINEIFKLGDSIHIKGDAKAFMGATISNAKVNYSVSRFVTTPWRYQNIESQIIGTGITATDQDGSFEISFVATPDSLISKDSKPVFIYTVEADVTDINGETRSSSKTVRIGYHNLKIDVQLSNQLRSDQEHQIQINTTNLNDEDIESNVHVTVNKLSSPNRILRKKPWNVVEINSIPREKFIELFPYEVYDSTDLRNHWTKGKEIFNKSLNTGNEKVIALSGLEQWDSGLYQIDAKAIDASKDTLVVSRQFEIIHPNDNHLPDNQLFKYEISNHNYKKDGYVELKLKTAADTLNIIVDASYKGKEIFAQVIPVYSGTKTIKVPIGKRFTDKIDFILSFIKYNSFVKKDFQLNLPELKNELKIETITFRDRIIPDTKETWNFKISAANKKNTDAEVLASMYDTSLDQFTEHRWRTNISYNLYESSYTPYYQNNGTFRVDSFHSFPYFHVNNLSAIVKNYHRLNFFGFNFGETKYTNNQYINQLKTHIDKKEVIEGNISGIITDESGLPLPGVNVMISGTNFGTQTDFDGYYTIEAPKGSVLNFSYVGLKTVSSLINKSGTHNFIMEEDAAMLDEVVVTAQGIRRERSALGYTTSILNSKDLSNMLESRLSGKVAGVTISTKSATPGAPENIIIRGVNSFPSSNQTLFIIDGVPMDAKDGVQISPEDIADVTVLKGASAVALYGTRGANGVVIINTKEGLEALTQVEARNDLKETALFFPHLRTNENGEVVFSFDSPQALTKWKLSLFAHSKKLEIGSLHKFTVTQKDINVIPNLPRFLREGDTIVFNARINNLTETSLNGNSMLQLFNGITMEPLNSNMIMSDSIHRFNVLSKGSTSQAWKIKVPQGLEALQYKIVAKSGSHTDGESGIIPVFSNRKLITEAHPIWIPAGGSKEYLLDKLKKPASDTQDNHLLTIEYTSNPAWLAIKSLPYLMNFPYECAEQTFSKYYANALAYQIVNDNPEIEDVFTHWKENGSLNTSLDENEELKSILISESPWVQDLKNEKDIKANFATHFDKERLKEQELQTISKLKELQLESGGFPWFAGGRANNFITRHIVSGIGHLERLKIDTEYSYNLEPILKKALKYLDNEFIVQYDKTISRTKDSSNVNLNSNNLHYLYTRSFFINSHPPSDKLKDILNIYLDECEESWATKSLYDKVISALSISRFRNKIKAQPILEALKEQAVINDENGMYWKENTRGWSWYKAPIETQALAIEAFSEIDNDQKSVELLKQWLLKNKKTSQWSTTKATTEAIYALLNYGKDWLSIKDKTTFSIGDEKIKTSKLEAASKEAGTGYFKLNWRKDEISPSLATIKVKNNSKIVGSGGIYWQYFEDLDKVSKATNDHLSIKKEMFVKVTNNDGEKLLPIDEVNTINIGDLVTVRLEIKPSQDLEFIHLKDLRPSGLEPIDVLSEYKWREGVGYYHSTRDVATHFFFDKLPKGTYVFEYNLRANNMGNFSNGIATIQSMYAPEFSSHSTGKRVEIRSN